MSGAVEIHRGSHGLVVAAFPATWLRLEVDTRDNDTAERPETLRQVLDRRPDVVAAVDAAMFNVADGLPYARSQASDLLYRYLDRASGIDVASEYPRRGATLSVDARGVAHLLDGDAVCEGAVFAHQGYPAMISGGINVASREHDRDRNGRAALVLCEDGRVAFAVAECGIRDLARKLLALPGSLRAVGAAYLDGGGSTALAVRHGGTYLVDVGRDRRRVPAYVLAVQP